jgi:hypothetical protein
MELVASADVLGAMQDLVIAEEPEALQTLTEEHNDIDDEGDDDASSVNDDDLPRWAQRGGFTDSELPRAHALLVAFLPASFLAHLPTSPDRVELLNALSSGQLLCAAFEDTLSASAAANPEGMIELEPK